MSTARLPSIASGAAELLLRPGTFFSVRRPVISGAAVPVMMAVLGLATLAQVYESMLRVAATSESRLAVLSGVTLLMLVVVGPLHWSIGRALFRLRVRWAGAPSADSELSTAIFGFSELIRSGGVVTWAAVDIVFAPVRPSLSPTVVILTAWSLFVSYQGVRAVFPVSPWKARVWFLFLPAAFYAWGYWKSL